MFRLINRLAIAAFAIAITLFAIAMATGLEYVFYPEEFVTTAPGKKAIIVSLIAFPCSWGVGEIIRTNQLLTEELRLLVSRDRLTDVATRDFFFARMERDEDAYGISLMVDIDHFKQVNDTHGHLVGDDVIRAVAQALRGQVRAEDIVCRFGGEEFVIFLFERDATFGFEVAERMRVAIAQRDIKIDGGPISVTVSIGGSLKERLTDVNSAIRQADVALYRAKRGGRNKTVFYDPGMEDSAMDRAG